MDSRDRHSWWMFPIRVDEHAAGISRDRLIDALEALNIGMSVHYTRFEQAFRAFCRRLFNSTASQPM
jgi:dTDP-4-amino-4,6-dideoxygalactose transaminase